MSGKLIKITQIRKRNNSIQSFEKSKITNAIHNAMLGLEKGGKKDAKKGKDGKKKKK